MLVDGETLLAAPMGAILAATGDVSEPVVNALASCDVCACSSLAAGQLAAELDTDELEETKLAVVTVEARIEQLVSAAAGSQLELT